MHKPLDALLALDRIITDLQAADRWQAIDELLGKAQQGPQKPQIAGSLKKS
jgi:hypothetical protein